METWKEIKDFPDYEISNLGHVRNKKNNKIKLTPINSVGYKHVSLMKDGKQYVVKIHRLIAIAFIPNLENKSCINHIDGDKTNNSIDNLEWCTYSENNTHALNIGLRITPKGEESSVSKLRENDVMEILELLKTNMVHRDIAKIYNISESTISSIKTCNSWKHIKRI